MLYQGLGSSGSSSLRRQPKQLLQEDPEVLQAKQYLLCVLGLPQGLISHGHAQKTSLVK